MVSSEERYILLAMRELASEAKDWPDEDSSMTSLRPQIRTLDCRGRAISLGHEVTVMGILNVTPDSFSDGGAFIDTARAVARAVQMVSEGAAIIDVGGQSTRPGFTEISVEEEIARILPVIEALVSLVSVPISVDTYKPAVARAALSAGAHLLNDVYGLQGDPDLAQIAAELSAPVVIMHQEATFRHDSADTIVKLFRFFEKSLAVAARVGIARDRCVLDPGIGFLKSHAQNLEIIARVGELRAGGLPILLGVSRKSTIGEVLNLPAAERLEGTLATTAIAAWQGIELVRVHDVAANVRAAKMASALRAALPI